MTEATSGTSAGNEAGGAKQAATGAARHDDPGCVSLCAR